MLNGSAALVVGRLALVGSVGLGWLGRLGSLRLGWRIAPFFQRVKSYFIQFITNQLPETGRIMPWLRLFAFAGRTVV